MFRKINKQISLFIIVALLMALTVPSFAASQDHWAKAVLEKWADNGFIQGYPDGVFKPDQAITRGEFVTLIDRVFKFTEKSTTKFKDVSEGKDYTDAVYKAAAAGVMIGDGNGNFRPDSLISREEAAVTLTRAFSLKAVKKDSALSFSDASKISKWSAEAISAMIEKAYITGRPGNLFDPKANLTNAEAVKMIDNVAGEVKNASGTYTGDVSGNLTVNSPSVTLENMTISGDLFLTQGVGDGEVTLNSVKVTGRIVVKGGGENSIVLNNSSAGTLVVIKKDGKVRVVLKGSSEIADVQMASGGKLEEDGVTGGGFGDVELLEIVPGQSITLDGDFESISLEAPGISLAVGEGTTIGNLSIGSAAAGAQINVAAGSTITQFISNANVTVAGTGTIKSATVNVAGTTFEKAPEKVTAPVGVSYSAGGKTIEGTGAEQVNTPAPTTGGGGGGGGGGSTVSASAISLIKAGDDIAGTVSGNSATFNLSNKITYPDSLMIDGMSITANPTDSILTITDVTSSTGWDSGNDRDVDNLSDISVPDLTGTNIFGDDISLGSLRLLFGSTITVTGTLKHEGWNSKVLSVTINLGEAPDELATKLFDVEVHGKTATATVSNPVILSHKVSGYGITALLTSLIGLDDMPTEISLNGGTTWLSVTTAAARTTAQSAIAEECDTTWAELKVEDLIGQHIYARMNAGDVYDITIAAP